MSSSTAHSDSAVGAVETPGRYESALGSGTAKLTISRALTVAIGFATGPIIARLFSPADFGTFGFVGAIAAWTGAFACLNYDQAIPLSESRSETHALLRLCLLLTLLLLVPATLLPLAAGGPLARAVGKPGLGPFLWFVPIMFLFAAFTRMAQYTCSRYRRFGTLSLVTFGSANASRGALILFGLLFGGGALYLFLGSLLGTVAGLAIVAIALTPVFLASAKKRDVENNCSLSDAARRHKQFPKVQIWNSVLNQSSRSVPVLLMGVFFNTAVVGYYALGLRYLTLPVSVLAASIAQVFYAEGAREWHANGTVSENIRKTVRILAATCLFPMLAVGMLGPLLFETIFGSRWHEAGVYSQILTPWLFASLVASPISTVFLIRNRAGTLLAYNVILLVIRSGAIVLGQWAGQPRIGLLCLSAGSGLVYLHLLWLALRLGNASPRATAVTLLTEGARASLAVLPAALVFWLSGDQLLSLGLLLAAAMVHFTLLYRRESLLQAKAKALWRRLVTTVN